MRVLSIAGLVFLGCLLSGCIVTIVTSRQPFYLERDVVREPSLLGAWTVAREGETTDPPETWTFEKAEDLENAYRLTVVEQEGVGVFTAHLFRLADRTFLDLLPRELPEESSEDFGGGASLTYLLHLHMTPVHSVWRIWLDGDTMRPATLDIDWFGQQTVKDTAGLQVEASGGESDDEVDVCLLNGSTSSIQKFVTQHATDSAAFTEPMVLRRTEPPTPTK